MPETAEIVPILIDPAHEASPWAYALLGWLGGIAATIAGSWIASKIRVYHDNKQSHYEDLKVKVLSPLREALTKNSRLFRHEEPVVIEIWDRLRYAKTVNSDEEDATFGAVLQSVNPWPEILAGIDRALLEDARTAHYKKLISEVTNIAVAWETHSRRCQKWAAEVALSHTAESPR